MDPTSVMIISLWRRGGFTAPNILLSYLNNINKFYVVLEDEPNQLNPRQDFTIKLLDEFGDRYLIPRSKVRLDSHRIYRLLDYPTRDPSTMTSRAYYARYYINPVIFSGEDYGY